MWRIGRGSGSGSSPWVSLLRQCSSRAVIVSSRRAVWHRSASRRSGPAYRDPRTGRNPGESDRHASHRTDRRGVGALLAGIALAGCGSSSGSSSSGATGVEDVGGDAARRAADKKIDVCTIITPADAEKVIGGPVEAQAAGEQRGSVVGRVHLPGDAAAGSGSACSRCASTRGRSSTARTLLPDDEVDRHRRDRQGVRPRRPRAARTIDVQFVKDGQTGAINFTDTARPSARRRANVEAVAQSWPTRSEPSAGVAASVGRAGRVPTSSMEVHGGVVDRDQP